MNGFAITFIVLFSIGFPFALISFSGYRFEDSYNDDCTHVLKWVSGIIVGVSLIFLLIPCISFVQEGEIGIVETFGFIDENYHDAGIVFKNPFSKLIIIDKKTKEYTMSSISTEGEKEGDDSIKTISSDVVKVSLNTTIFYRIRPDMASALYKEVGLDFDEKIIRPLYRTIARESSTKFKAMEIFSSNISDYEEEIKAKFESNSTFSKYFILENVSNKDMNLPNTIQVAINEKISAGQELQEMEFKISQEENKIQIKKSEADGIAKAQNEIQANLTGKYLMWYQIDALKAIADSDCQAIILMPFDSSLSPNFNINEIGNVNNNGKN
jgi:regulator of protease activity HflC (stomatin/prohibitin superfamily)